MSQPNGPGRISVAALKRRLDAGERMVLLDVREDFERRVAVIGANLPVVADVHVPVRQVPEHIERLSELAMSAPLVVYCHHGVRSRMVAEWLFEQGIQDVVDLVGGIDAWSIQVDQAVRRY